MIYCVQNLRDDLRGTSRWEADCMVKALQGCVHEDRFAAAALRDGNLVRTWSTSGAAFAVREYLGQPGRWYCGEYQFDGPLHHSLEDWQLAIGSVVVEHEKLLAQQLPPPPAADHPKRRRRDWWNDDYPGKVASPYFPG